MSKPVPYDEREFTPFAEAGWTAWDSYSAEAEFCEFVGTIQRFTRPDVVLETGVGAGRIADHLDLGGCAYLGFESAPEWRCPPANQAEATPTAEHFACADMVILDSAAPFRVAEIAGWAAHGRPGSVCIVHDCGNGHPEQYATHHNNRAAVEATGIVGVWLHNPRGGWMGVHP